MSDADTANNELYDALEAESGAKGKYASQMLKTADHILKQDMPDVRQGELVAYCIRQALRELVRPPGVQIKKNKEIIDKILAIKETIMDGQCGDNSALYDAIDELGSDRRGNNEKYTTVLIEHMVGSAHAASKIIKQYTMLLNKASCTLHDVTRVSINTVRGDYEQALCVLNAMFLPNERQQTIQKLAGLIEPTKDDVRSLQALITTSSDWSYFAENVVSSKWFKLLENEDLLHSDSEGGPWRLGYFADYLKDEHYEELLELINRNRKSWGIRFKHEDIGNREMAYALSRLGDRGIPLLATVLRYVEPKSKNFGFIHRRAHFALTKATRFDSNLAKLAEWLLKNIKMVAYPDEYEIIKTIGNMAGPSDIPTVIAIVIGELKVSKGKANNLISGLHVVLKRAEDIGTPEQQLSSSLSDLNSIPKNELKLKFVSFYPRADHIECFRKLIKYGVKLEEFLKSIEHIIGRSDAELASKRHAATTTSADISKKASQTASVDSTSSDFDALFKNEVELKNAVKKNAAGWASDPPYIIETLQKPRLITAYLEGLSETDESLVPFEEKILWAIQHVTKQKRNRPRVVESWREADLASLKLIERIIKGRDNTNLSKDLLRVIWDIVSIHLKRGLAPSKTYTDNVNYMSIWDEAYASPSVSATYTAICLLRFSHSKECRDMILTQLERLLLLPAKEGGALYRAFIGPNMPFLHYVSEEWFAKNKSLVFDDEAPDNLGRITFILYLALGNPHKQTLEGRAMKIINVTYETRDTNLIYKLWRGMFDNLPGYKPRDISEILYKIKDAEYVSSACWSLSKILSRPYA